jgi:hypothetical protein
MQVFKPSDEIHTLIFIPRISTISVLLEIKNELRNTENSIGINGEMINGVFIGNFNYNFTEGASYELDVKDLETDNLLFRGKAFATNEEDLQNYKLIR